MRRLAVVGRKRPDRRTFVLTVDRAVGLPVSETEDRADAPQQEEGVQLTPYDTIEEAEGW